jgi:hypothetical protein
MKGGNLKRLKGVFCRKMLMALEIFDMEVLA